jgi:hypothetical protein
MKDETYIQGDFVRGIVIPPNATEEKLDKIINLLESILEELQTLERRKKDGHTF